MLREISPIIGPFNSLLQNAPWTAKRPELLKYTKIDLAQYFHGTEAIDWHEDFI